MSALREKREGSTEPNATEDLHSSAKFEGRGCNECGMSELTCEGNAEASRCHIAPELTI